MPTTLPASLQGLMVRDSQSERDNLAGLAHPARRPSSPDWRIFESAVRSPGAQLKRDRIHGARAAPYDSGVSRERNISQGHIDSPGLHRLTTVVSAPAGHYHHPEAARLHTAPQLTHSASPPPHHYQAPLRASPDQSASSPYYVSGADIHHQVTSARLPVPLHHREPRPDHHSRFPIWQRSYHPTKEPRTSPLPDRAGPSHYHPFQPDLTRRHSDQSRRSDHLHDQPPHAVPRPGTAYESVNPAGGDGNPGSRPASISRTREACNHCRAKKIRCNPGEADKTTGQLAACDRCLVKGFECTYSGTQKKRGPCPGTTRPTTSPTGTGAVQGTSKRKKSTPSKITPPKFTKDLPAMTRDLSDQAEESGPTSARSSIASLDVLTPEDDRRGSYEFVNPPQYPIHPRAQLQSQAPQIQSAPLHASSSSSWPRHPDPRLHDDLPPWQIKRATEHNERAPLPIQVTRQSYPERISPTRPLNRSLFDDDYSLRPRLPSVRSLELGLPPPPPPPPKYLYPPTHTSDDGPFGRMGVTLPPIRPSSRR